jgi:tRNA/tmRNA/rRNA uracil-C5-methylase (TrmA/RlmC/RlmD family)
LNAPGGRETLLRPAHVDVPVEVESVPGDHSGLGWRTRVQYAVDGDGRLGFRRHRSHDVVPVETCPIAHPQVQSLPVTARTWSGASGVEVVVGSGDGDEVVVVRGPEPVARQAPPAAGLIVDDRAASAPARRGGRRTDRTAGAGLGHPPAERRVRGRGWVQQTVQVGSWQRTFRVSGTGFWQVHPGAASIFVAAVLEALEPKPGERVLDLYAGAGLFAGALADRVGTHGEVVAVESDAGAVRDARRNLHDLPQVQLVEGRVDAVLRRTSQGDRCDLVVLDPPRTGARAAVVREVAARRPRAIAYVACDPAALARDVALFAERGYRLEGVRVFDAFPMTQHVECVARLVENISTSR